MASDFTSATGARIDAAGLGWVPQVVSGPSVAGPAVAPGAGLSVPRLLVTGEGRGTTQATAQLTR